MASDVQRWFDSEARQTEAIARAERDALAAEVSALRAALEAAETDAQLCRERLGDERERRRAAEALAVPEGWHIEYGEICGYGGRCRHANRLHAHLLLDSDDDPPARLVPSPPPSDGWWDTGHTPKACDCNHHWDAHTPFRGCSVCSCKKDPPNQPPPPGEPESEKP